MPIAFCDSVAAYVNTRIINEVTAPDDRFEWSERWYDLDSTKPEKRFHLVAAVVLQQITEQTGIQFAEEKQVVPGYCSLSGRTAICQLPMLLVNGANDPRLPSHRGTDQHNRQGGHGAFASR
jgi:hypothetical protein